MRDIPPRMAAVIVALALIASLVSGGERLTSGGPAVGEPAARAVDARRAAPAEAARDSASLDDLDLEQLKRREKQDRVPDLFAGVTPAAPPVRRAPSAPAPAATIATAPLEAPAKPVAPQLPFRYLGHLADGGKTSVFLERSQETLSVPVGETISGTYKVESITEKAVVFVYLPLGETQTLPIPARQ